MHLTPKPSSLGRVSQRLGLYGICLATAIASAQESLPLLPKWTRFQGELVSLKPVSYTHLTLPTSDLV